MTLEERCQAQFAARDRRRGQRYFLSGRVRIVSIQPDGLFATVRGSTAYEVSLDWTATAEGTLSVSCECPHFARGYLCKHVWATILAADREPVADAIPGVGALHVEVIVPGEWDEKDEAAIDLLVGRTESGSRSGAARPSMGELRDLLLVDSQLGRQSSPPPTSGGWARSRGQRGWRGTLRLVRDALGPRGPEVPAEIITRVDKKRRAYYLVDLREADRTGSLTIDLFKQETLKNGEWGKIKALSLGPSDPPVFVDQDRDVLELLLAIANPPSPLDAYGAYRSTSEMQRRITIPVALFDHVLPRLCATQRLCCGVADPNHDPLTPLSWDEREAYQPQLRLARVDERTYHLEMILERQGSDESRPLAEAKAIFRGGLVAFTDTLVRLDAGDLMPWVNELATGPLRVPEARLDDLLTEFWRLPVVPPLDLPDELDLEGEPMAPVPCLAVDEARDPYARGILAAEISFEYGDDIVPAGETRAGIPVLEDRRVVLRDPEAERAAIASLGELGFTAPPYYERRRDRLRLQAKAFPEVTLRLIEDGWRLRWKNLPIRQPGELQLRVESGIDWFELEGDVDFDDVSVELPRLLEALRRGERFVELGDGSRGMVPEDWVRDFGLLARLAQATDDAETVRFLPSQALLLDALLATAPAVDVDRRFAQVRRRLASFEGIERVPEPRGFRGELRGYQREGLGWLRFLQEFGFGGCLADDMGLGKTVQVLAMLQGRRAAGQRVRRTSLVVAPRSVLHNWADEAKRFTPRLDVLVYHGPGRKKLRDQFADHDIVLTTYAVMRLDIVHLRETVFDVAVLDEAQAIKNSGSQVAKASRLIQADHRLALTGTPIENHLGELWSLFEFLNPGMLGRLPSLAGHAGARTLDSDSLHIVAKSLRPFILRRSKEQVLKDLPEKTEQTLFCDLGGKQRRLYDELRAHYRAQLDDRVREMGLARSKIQVLEALLRLRQAACHQGLLDPERVDEPSAKLDLLAEQLEEVLAENHKVLVFSQFTTLLAILRRSLDRQGMVYEYLDGATRNRRQKVDRFQTDPDCRLFLISLKAGGLGLNLTAADYVYILDPWWNPAVEAQAVDRAHRIGQTRPVFAYRLISRDTVEEKILELQASKRELADAIVSADQSLIRNLTADDLRLLLS